MQSVGRSRPDRAVAPALVLCGLAMHCGNQSTPPSPTHSNADAVYACGHAPTGLDASAAELAHCFPDHDGINGGHFVFDLTVDDTGFSKTILATQNDATVTLTLENTGKKPHGIEVECTSVKPAYPTVPAGCPDLACFPSNATIAPLMPGETRTVTFVTPTPDGLLYPVKSSNPEDCSVPGLNGSMTQWSLM
jgi:hypothetical protein